MPPKEPPPADGHTLVVVGSGGVGKSCLTVKFLKGEFLQDYDPTIEENYRKKITFEGRETTLDIIDTAGQQEYVTLRDSHLRTGHGFLLCYSITDDTSFVELKELHQAILRLKDGGTRPPFVVVGCKKDLEHERKVTTADAKAFADNIKSPFVETSAKSGDGVETAFELLVKEIRTISPGQPGKAGPAKKTDKKGGCVLL